MEAQAIQTVTGLGTVMEHPLMNPKGRVRFVKAAMRTLALKLYPWAQHTLQMDGGYYCFEFKEDLIDYKERNKWEYCTAKDGGHI